ncbi:MAG: hypothetical protein GY853_09725 [PVC group bacterium]|nr:hypothetical protein [PVC group bacterium]
MKVNDIVWSIIYKKWAEVVKVKSKFVKIRFHDSKKTKKILQKDLIPLDINTIVFKDETFRKTNYVVHSISRFDTCVNVHFFDIKIYRKFVDNLPLNSFIPVEETYVKKYYSASYAYPETCYFTSCKIYQNLMYIGSMNCEKCENFHDKYSDDEGIYVVCKDKEIEKKKELVSKIKSKIIHQVRFNIRIDDVYIYRITGKEYKVSHIYKINKEVSEITFYLNKHKSIKVKDYDIDKYFIKKEKKEMKYKVGDKLKHKTGNNIIEIERIEERGKYPYHVSKNNGIFSEDYLDEYYIKMNKKGKEMKLKRLVAELSGKEDEIITYAKLIKKKACSKAMIFLADNLPELNMKRDDFVEWLHDWNRGFDANWIVENFPSKKIDEEEIVYDVNKHKIVLQRDDFRLWLYFLNDNGIINNTLYSDNGKFICSTLEGPEVYIRSRIENFCNGVLYYAIETDEQLARVFRSHFSLG